MLNESEFAVKTFRDSIIRALVDTAVPLQKIAYTKENYEILFSETIESPIETLKMGANQFEKFGKSDRNYLLAAAYRTLTSPSIVLCTKTLDKKTNTLKSVHIYGKSFYHEEKGKSRAVESVIVFKDNQNIVIGTHNKDFSRFVGQIKTADQLIYADRAVSRIVGQCRAESENVRTEGVYTQFLNPRYDENRLLSIENLIAEERLALPTLSP